MMYRKLIYFNSYLERLLLEWAYKNTYTPIRVDRVVLDKAYSYFFWCSSFKNITIGVSLDRSIGSKSSVTDFEQRWCGKLWKPKEFSGISFEYEVEGFK